jgi:hypothetical protein
MSTVARSAFIAFCVTVLAAFAGASIGCGGSGDADKTPEWKTVISTDVSGDKPVKLLLGTFPLGDRVRLAWDLSGPEDPPPVMLTLRVVDVMSGTGFGASVSPGDPLFTLSSEEVLVLGPFKPRDYRLYFSQRFPPSKGPGYDVKLTISTTK